MHIQSRVDFRRNKKAQQMLGFLIDALALSSKLCLVPVLALLDCTCGPHFADFDCALP